MMAAAGGCRMNFCFDTNLAHDTLLVEVVTTLEDDKGFEKRVLLLLNSFHLTTLTCQFILSLTC